jgi:cytochrome c oxidase cbb3-type subunit 3
MMLALALAAFALGGCRRELRSARPPAALAGLAGTSSIDPDTRLTGGVSLTASAPRALGEIVDPYNGIAYELGEGKRLFFAYNCNGCHGQGGGGIGPPLSDTGTRYGNRPLDIYTTIVYGRSNGMPSFRGKMSEAHVWRLVAYVRALGGLVPRSAAPARSDHMSVRPPENTLDPQMPAAAARARR